MAKLKVIFLQCTLIILISAQIRSEELQRDKRDLNFIKNFLSSTIFGHKGASPLVENGIESPHTIHVPKGYKVIYVNRIPGSQTVQKNPAISSKFNIIKAFLETKDVKETQKALSSAADLIKTGIVTEEVVPLRVGSSHSQFNEVIIPEQQGFFSSELHAPSHFAPKPFVNTLSADNVQAPPKPSFGEVSGGSFGVSFPDKAPSIGSRFSYKQSYLDGTNVVYDGSIRTGDRIPQQISKDINYIIPPSFFINRVQNIGVVPISEPVKSAYSYNTIHNHNNAPSKHKLPIIIPVQHGHDQQLYLAPHVANPTEFKTNNAPSHHYSYISSDYIPKNNLWQSSISPHFYRYIQTYSPPLSPVVAINFTPTPHQTITNYPFSNNNGKNIIPPAQADHLNVNNDNKFNNNNDLSNLDKLPKSSVKDFNPNEIKISEVATSTQTQLDKNVHNHFSFIQKDATGNNIIYKNDKVYVENNPDISVYEQSHYQQQELPISSTDSTNISEVGNILPENTITNTFSSVDTGSRSNFPSNSNTLPSSQLYLSNPTQEIESYERLPNEGDITKFNSNDYSSAANKEIFQVKQSNYEPNVQYTFTQKDTSGNNIVYKNNNVFVENNHQKSSNQLNSEKIESVSQYTQDQENHEYSPGLVAVDKVTPIYKENESNATPVIRRRKIFRRVKVKQNVVKNFKTKYEAPLKDTTKQEDESINNKPIVVLPQAESTFSYKQINGDGSTRTIHDSNNNSVIVDVEENSKNERNRGDIPL